MPKREEEAARLEKEASAPDFWGDSRAAQAHMQRLAGVRAVITTWRSLETESRSLSELVEMAIADEEEDEALAAEVRRELEGLEARLERLNFELLMGGEYDRHGAILAIHAGAGGTESQDWTEMLLTMYLRWADKRGHKAQVLEVSQGEEAGIKRVHLEVQGEYAYGYLKGEGGVHRLIRLSPFDADHLRHTSFALVEVLPDVETDVAINIAPADLRIDVYRASGAGGQNVQKNSTAVRIVHLPTGITVTCQNERSQHQNREIAIKILRARLMERELARQAAEQARLRGQHVDAGWGNQIRTYVLHPYQMVRDHRTGLERSDPEAVLMGDLDNLLEGYLKSTVGAR